MLYSFFKDIEIQFTKIQSTVFLFFTDFAGFP